MVADHGKQLEGHDDRIAKLEDEIQVLKSLGAPSGDGDNSGHVLEALGTMIKNLEQRLNTRMGNLEEELNRIREEFVRKPDFETAIADLDERKADRSELEEKYQELKDYVDGIEIPEQAEPTIIKETIIKQQTMKEPVKKVTPTQRVKAYDGVVLTMAMVERWDSMDDRLDAVKKQLEDLERRMML